MTSANGDRFHDDLESGLSTSRAQRVARIDRTLWGEQSETRVVHETASTSFTLLDYRAPAGFGPPRHVHHEQDEVFDIREGRIVVWTPHECRVFGPGDIVVLPHGLPHAWRGYGEASLHFSVMLTPARTAGLEHFFSHIVEHHIPFDDVRSLSDIAGKSGFAVIGPPLSNDEVEIIITGGRVN